MLRAWQQCLIQYEEEVDEIPCELAQANTHLYLHMLEDTELGKLMWLVVTCERRCKISCLGERNMLIVTIMQQVYGRMNLINHPAGRKFIEQSVNIR